MSRTFLFLLPFLLILCNGLILQLTTATRSHRKGIFIRQSASSSPPSSASTSLYNSIQPQNEKEVKQIEEARLNIWKSRRQQIRSMLKSAESLRNFRLQRGLVPELDEDGMAVSDNGKSAVTITAFAVTAGAIILRIGGRAALVSAVGLDFLTDNPELQNQVNSILEYTGSMDPIIKAGLFCLGWTFVKVFCFDAAGVVLALSSGILFDGVLPGTLLSAFGATVGSSIAFGLAKADTPIRKKALEIVQDNPSLRGIQKVVADEGLKAVLTLRLAPVLPIPLGMYNYVYGISNVKYLDFAGGIFLGSLKPYFLDSYLGYFGKTLVDGTAGQEGGWQDYILIGILGVSVLIGVFASQLASETWDAVLQEQKEEEEENKGGDDDEDDVVTEIFEWELPQWVVGFQYSLQDADKRMTNLVLQEFDAKVWNCTDDASFLGITISESNLPDSRNPALVDPTSPEIIGRNKGIDFGESTCDGLVLSPILFTYFLELADPLFDEDAFQEKRDLHDKHKVDEDVFMSSTTLPSISLGEEKNGVNDSKNVLEDTTATLDFQKGVILDQLQALRDEAKQRLQDIEKKMDQIDI